MSKKLHIVSFNIPYPADYGGVIDVFYKLKSLHEIGFEITLHCFEYGRLRQVELEKYCSKVIYYPRKKSILDFLHITPFIVKSRGVQLLLKNLEIDNAPILFEGLHTCYFLKHPLLKDKIKIVRTHNIEHRYYFYLFRSENDLFKKVFFFFEFIKLYLYQPSLKYADKIIAISKDEEEYFFERFGKTQLVSAFHPYQQVKISLGVGDYFLYHGDLSVKENEKAVRFLIKKVFNHSGKKFIIAGKNPPIHLITYASKYGVDLIPNPTDEYLNELIKNAQAHVLPTFQSTGVKLKLLNVLHNGRFVIVNSPMVKNSVLKELCLVAHSVTDWKRILEEISFLPFDEKDVELRKEILSLEFNNYQNALLLEKAIYAP